MGWTRWVRHASWAPPCLPLPLPLRSLLAVVPALRVVVLLGAPPAALAPPRTTCTPPHTPRRSRAQGVYAPWGGGGRPVTTTTTCHATQC